MRFFTRTAHRAGAVATVAVTVLTFGLVACGSDANEGGAKPAIRLGALLSINGEDPVVGRGMRDGLTMAVNEANAHGGVLGRRVELVIDDDACDPGTAVVKANDLVTKDIAVSVGGTCSAATVPSLKAFRDAGIPMIIPAANSTDLLVPQYDSVFLLSGTTTIEARYAVDTMNSLGSHRLIVIDDGTSFTRTLATGTAAAVRQRGGITVAGQLTLSEGAPNYNRFVAMAKQRHADTVFFTGYPRDAAKLVRDLHASGYSGTILLSDGSMDRTLLGMLNAAQDEGVYGLQLPQAQFEPRAAAWAARFKAEFHKAPAPFSMQSYDAVNLALNAIQRAGSLDRPAIREAIAATTPRDIRLLSGPSVFNSDGTQAGPVFDLLKIEHGAFTLVRRFE